MFNGQKKKNGRPSSKYQRINLAKVRDRNERYQWPAPRVFNWKGGCSMVFIDFRKSGGLYKLNQVNMFKHRDFLDVLTKQTWVKCDSDNHLQTGGLSPGEITTTLW